MRYWVKFPDGRERAVDVEPSGAVSVDGVPLEVEDLGGGSQAGEHVLRIGGEVVHLWLETKTREGELAPEVGVVTRSGRFYANVESERSRLFAVGAAKGGAGGDGTVTSPMPGRVLKVLVAEGDAVEAGSAVVVVEAMKMENEIAAPRSGKVVRVHVAAGASVEGGARLVEIQ